MLPTTTKNGLVSEIKSRHEQILCSTHDHDDDNYDKDDAGVQSKYFHVNSIFFCWSNLYFFCETKKIYDHLSLFELD